MNEVWIISWPLPSVLAHPVYMYIIYITVSSFGVCIISYVILNLLHLQEHSWLSQISKQLMS